MRHGRMRRWALPAAVFAALSVRAPGPARARVTVNEIVPRPAGGEGEWVELRNGGPEPVDLGGWALADGTGKARAFASAVVPPGGFLVAASRPESLRAAYGLPPETPVVRPSGWPVLNDHDAGTGLPADAVVLLRPDGAAEDSAVYFEAWLPAEPGRSLERVGAESPATAAGSWGWSLDPRGATPGAVNSLAVEGAPAGTLDGPGSVSPARRPAVFRFRLPGPGTLALWLVERDGARVAVLRAPSEASAVGQWVWGSAAPAAPRPGLYYLCLRWRGEGAASIRVCRPVWVEP